MLKFVDSGELTTVEYHPRIKAIHKKKGIMRQKETVIKTPCMGDVLSRPTINKKTQMSNEQRKEV